MKKVLMILLGLALVFSMAGVAAADQTLTSGGSSGTTEVYYDVSESYTVTIPDKILVNSVLSIGCGAAIIDADSYVNIYMNSTNGYSLHLDDGNGGHAMVNGNHVSLNYTIALLTGLGSELGNPLFTHEQGTASYLIYTVKSGKIHSDNDLHIKLVDVAETAGYYSDHLTFTVMVQEEDEFETEKTKTADLADATTGNFISN